MMKGQDIEAIMALYPEHAAELKPLLITALETKKAAAIKPHTEFRQRAGYEFQAAIRNMPPAKARNPFKWQLQWLAPVALVIVLVLGGGGTVLAASNSLPDSPLYKVKLATEAVQLAFASSDLGKAELYSRFANERVHEIVKMAEKGNTEQVQKVTERMDNQLFAMANLTARGGKNTLTADSAMLHAPAAMPSTTKAAATVPPETPAPTTAPPSLGQTPPETTVTVPPATTSIEPGPGANRSQTSEDAGYNNANQKPDRNEKLKNNLVKNTGKNLKALQDELEKAPEPLKAAIQRAIDILLNGYEENISNLGY
jgi:hypothetical protein